MPRSNWLGRTVCAAVVGLSLVSAASALNMETVPVGNPGNRTDSTGYGAVGYNYNIGKYEVTAGQYTEFLNKVAGVDTYGLYNTYMWDPSPNFGDLGCKIERYAGAGTTGDPYQYRVAADYANRPVNYVSWGDSARFANWMHNGQPTGSQDLMTTEDGSYYLDGVTTNEELTAVVREADATWVITSEKEWYKAAYHKNDGVTRNYFDYPTSSDSVPGRDMTEAANPGNNANYYGSPFPIDYPHYTTVAGEFEFSDSPYGTFDQGGNVWEWNEAVSGGLFRGLRGASFTSYDGNGLPATDRHTNYPTLEDNRVGFRVALVPEPTSILLLALGGVGLLKRRRNIL